MNEQELLFGITGTDVFLDHGTIYRATTYPHRLARL